MFFSSLIAPPMRVEMSVLVPMIEEWWGCYIHGVVTLKQEWIDTRHAKK